MEINFTDTKTHPPALELHSVYDSEPSQSMFELASLPSDQSEEPEEWVKIDQVPPREFTVDMSRCNVYDHSGNLYLIELGSENVFKIKPGTADKPPQVFQASLERFEADQVRFWASTKKIPVSKTQNDTGKLYKPLVDSYEIRVLEIKPGTADEPLQASLHHCSIEFDDVSLPFGSPYSNVPFYNVPDHRFITSPNYALDIQNLKKPIYYTALSYTWGKPILEAKVECDGHIKRITRSLEIALKHCRRTDRSVVIWVDQLCINQEDDKEKQQQIPLMSSIYRHAHNTLIWLGEASAGSDSAIHLLQEINNYLQFTDLEVNPDQFEKWHLPPKESRYWKDIWDLFSREWFTRVWIIQEVQLSKNPWVACGDTIIDFNTITTACINLNTCGISSWLQREFSPEGERLNSQHDICVAIRNLRWQPQLESHLFSLLVETQPARCTDHRDKIYGLLGLCYESDRKAIKISYAEDYTASRLFCDMTVHHLETLNSEIRLTSVLCCAGHDLHDMPSWVPDWRQPLQTTPLGYSTIFWSIYNACGHFKKAEPGQSLFNTKLNNRPELRVRGILFDSLIKISDIFVNPDLSYENPSIKNQDLIASVNFVSHPQNLNSDNTLFDAFWHTWVAGKDHAGKSKCPPSYAEVFSLLLDESTGQSPSISGQTYSPRQRRPYGKGKLELHNLSERVIGNTFQKIRIAVRAALRNRRLGITKSGHLGLFPLKSKVGDVVSVIQGCHVPFLLRPVEKGKFSLVGDCYVYGIMDGEAISQYTSLPELVLV